MSIYKKQSEDPINFDTAQDFLKYYENHQKDIDNIHTRSLNLKYKIKDHTIGRKQGKLILYPNKQKLTENYNDTKCLSRKANDESNLSLEERYNKLKDVVMELIKKINEIESILNTIHQNYNHK